MRAWARCAVIDFPVDRVRPSACGEPCTPAAEILIFTGVRIERLGEQPSPVPKLGAATRTEW